jgi:hypothetical protein
METQSTNSSPVEKIERGNAEEKVERKESELKKEYRRPLLDIEQRGPINTILENNYNYILDYVTTGTPTRENNQTLDQTLLVWEFINGVGSLPKRNGVGPVTGGRRLNKSRKSRKTSRRNRH